MEKIKEVLVSLLVGLLMVVLISEILLIMVPLMVCQFKAIADLLK